MKRLLVLSSLLFSVASVAGEHDSAKMGRYQIAVTANSTNTVWVVDSQTGEVKRCKHYTNSGGEIRCTGFSRTSKQ